MCGYALKLFNIRKIYYILNNHKFGGISSLCNIDIKTKKIEYREKDILSLLQNFYERGNEKLELHKRHRYKKLKSD